MDRMADFGVARPSYDILGLESRQQQQQGHGRAV